MHYDNGSAAYRRNYTWYSRVAYVYESRHTNYMHPQLVNCTRLGVPQLATPCPLLPPTRLVLVGMPRSETRWEGGAREP